MTNERLWPRLVLVVAGWQRDRVTVTIIITDGSNLILAGIEIQELPESEVKTISSDRS